MQRQPVRHLQLQDIIQFELTCFNSSHCHRRSFTLSRWPAAPLLAILACCSTPPSITAQLAQAARSCLLTSRARAAPALNSSRLSVCAGAITSTSPIVYLLTSRPRLCETSLSLLHHLFLLLTDSKSPCSKSQRCTPSNFPQIATLLPSPAAARPPCYVDSLFTCSVKDSPRSVL